MTTTLFITGASSGIGAAVVDLLPDDIDRTVSFSRSVAGGEWIEADLSTPHSWDTVRHTIENRLDHHRPDHAIFFHCAGVMSPITALSNADPEEYAKSILLNFASGPALGQAFLTACTAREVRATLVLAGSPAAHKVLPATSHYSAGKAALEHWGKCAASEQTAESGNRVITVVPYAVLTDMVRSVMKQDPVEVPIVDYFRQVEADDGFATAEVTAQHIWTTITSAVNGSIVPVGAVHIADAAGSASPPVA